MVGSDERDGSEDVQAVYRDRFEEEDVPQDVLYACPEVRAVKLADVDEIELRSVLHRGRRY